jgi:hypothetical protein
MKELIDVLQTVKQRIDRYGSNGINEQDTKATLLQPVLRALGWDVEDLEEVQREYKIRKQDKPVDYSLFLLRTPCLFVEAKALGQNLDDRKWANQIMGYAGVAGVGWVVLTDGNEYRLYNSHAAVPIDEKLFRTVRVSDDPAKSADTLLLLSKKRMQENEINVLWKAHFVDRQVQAAVSELFSATPDTQIIRLLGKKLTSLTPKDIRTSLQRASISFNFPVRPSGDGKRSEARIFNGEEVNSRKAKPNAAKGRFAKLGIAKSHVLSVLIERGLLKRQEELSGDYFGKSLSARIADDGKVEFRGTKYQSPSAAGAAAKQSVTGKFMATDGWSFWHYKDENGELVPIKSALQRFLADANNNG